MVLCADYSLAYGGYFVAIPGAAADTILSPKSYNQPDYFGTDDAYRKNIKL